MRTIPSLRVGPLRRTTVLLVGSLLAQGFSAVGQERGEVPEQGAMLSFDHAVERVFRPADLDKFRWYVRIRVVPYMDLESEILVGYLNTQQHVVRRTFAQQGVYTLWKDGRRRFMDERELLEQIPVVTESREIPASVANGWLEQVFDAIARTPSEMQSASMLDTRPDGRTFIILHWNSYVVEFHDFNLQVKTAVKGPGLSEDPRPPLSLVHFVSNLKLEVDSLFSE